MKTAIESYRSLIDYLTENADTINSIDANNLYLNEIAQNTAIIADSLRLLVNYIVKDDSK